jgi:hypothetical protein
VAFAAGAVVAGLAGVVAGAATGTAGDGAATVAAACVAAGVAGEATGAGAGTGATGTATGVGEATVRGGRNETGSRYPWASDATRIPRWTYGPATSGSPLGPTAATD